MAYSYNAILGRGSINKFEVVIHVLCLCVRVPAPLCTITIYRDQQVAHNIERDFTPSQHNVHYLAKEGEEPTFSRSHTPKPNKESKPIQHNEEGKRVPLDSVESNKIVIIRQDLVSQEEGKLLACLDKNKNVFSWSSSGLVSISRNIIDHNLNIYPSIRPKKQRLAKMFDEKIEATRAKVQ